MERLKATEELLIQCEKDLKRLRAIRREIKQIEVNRKQLEGYYLDQYLEDYNEIADGENHYRILDQDSIWNVINDQYFERINLLKSLIKTL